MDAKQRVTNTLGRGRLKEKGLGTLRSDISSYAHHAKNPVPYANHSSAVSIRVMSITKDVFGRFVVLDYTAVDSHP